MKRIIIVCEGQTEQEFCKDLLVPFLSAKNTTIHYPTIKHSTGGITSWAALKIQIENHLKQERTAFVTTLIDYYGIQWKHSFPGWEISRSVVDLDNRMEHLEQAMLRDISTTLQHRFIPYIQLHEFEGLFFNRLDVFTSNFLPSELRNLNELERLIATNPNPELINDGPDTAPSKRLEKLIAGYSKITYGSLLAQEIGLSSIRTKCPRFNAWLNLLEQL